MTFFISNQNALENLGKNTIEVTCRKFLTLEPENIALTWLVYDAPTIVNTGGAIASEEFWRYPLRGYSYRGKERIFPASLVKLFYAVAVCEWLEAGMISDSKELKRAIKDMLVESSNDATSLIVDVLTGSTSGPELPPGPFQTWQDQRNIVNRYYQSLGWPELNSINVNQKTWSDGPYGRERAFLGELRTNRNMLSAEAITRLFHAIVGGVAVSSSHSQFLLDLLKRDLTWPNTSSEENQISGFLGEGIALESQLWSKAGWTSQVRHDAAYIETPNIQPYLLVVLTEGQANSQNREILPFISQQIATAMQKLPTWEH